MRHAKKESETLVGKHESPCGYSIGKTENRMPVDNYPGYNFKITAEVKNYRLTTKSQEKVQARRQNLYLPGRVRYRISVLPQ